MSTDEALEDFDNNCEHSDTECAFPFAKLPLHLAQSVLLKTEFDDYIQLAVCSKVSQSACLSLNVRLPLQINRLVLKKKYKRCNVDREVAKKFRKRIPFPLIRRSVRPICYAMDIERRLTIDLCSQLLRIFRKFPMTVYVLEIKSHVECDRKSLGDLLELLGVESLVSNVYIRPDLFDHPYANEIKKYELDTCRITNKQLKRLTNVEYFCAQCDTITDDGLNQLLKDQLSGQCNMEICIIGFNTTVGRRSIDTILSDLNANPIWTPALHNQSVAGAIDRRDIRELWTDHPRQFYSLAPSRNIRKAICLDIADDVFRFNSYRIEMDVFREILSEDQFYRALGHCPWCSGNVQFCFHRGPYSLARFSAAFPRTWNFVIRALKLCRLMLSGYTALLNLIT